MTYLETAAKFYSEVAQTPQLGLCCVQSSPLQLPGLKIPQQMQEMNYGCGTTVHATELVGNPFVLYVGVGGGLEALQFAYFSRHQGAIIAVDPVPAMRDAAARNLQLAAHENDWFDASFVEICEGNAFALPVPDASVDVVAQNCLFNIFEPADLAKALKEAYRVLKPGGRLLMSDPIATEPIPQHLKQDERLRALCLSGALTYAEYVQHLGAVGFGRSWGGEERSERSGAQSAAFEARRTLARPVFVRRSDIRRIRSAPRRCGFRASGSASEKTLSAAGQTQLSIGCGFAARKP